ncbi:MRP-L47-domain-containing protein [Dothidotthia symphoricarpi CBS 119687]|uniref:Large ribosomal subunit protein uL29m n=1 Tax=Dothidotthia symphoricarpi CBS 119687 TaxID=1392245 RepID=A0A6A5ZZE8_9PLEO|nr:MRP-L47-domain-containing protein [Dothidotthia symphoricarpi CBS 119687]KAF2124939.1 MRP-L47-domain-containing protein [Dothidotthia symphoricarpi CBS 119687]
MPSSRILRPSLASTTSEVLSFLVPSAQCARASVARFSTSPTPWKADNNKMRGVSSVRRTGLRPRQTLSVKEKDFENQRLPTPVAFQRDVKGTPDHGLWDFFKDKKLLQTPMEAQRHGRAWTAGELRSRDWDTLHQLWWVCVKERNRLATENLERARLKAGYGDHESNERDKTVQKTMKAILDTLTERNLAYQEALELAKQDPEIDLRRTDGPQYTPSAYDPTETDHFEDTQYGSAEAEPPVESQTINEPAIDKPLATEERPKEKVNAI